MAKVPLRIVGIGRDIELRVVSFLTRARQATEHVAFIDLGSEDETAILVEEVGCSLLTSESSDIVSIARCLIESDLEPAENYLFIHINKEWSLREFTLHLNRSRENWDVYIGLVSNNDEEESRPTHMTFPTNFVCVSLNQQHYLLCRKENRSQQLHALLNFSYG